MNIARVAAIAAIVLLPLAASAGPRDDLIDGMAKCAALTDNAARLACYDALNPTVKAAQAEPPPPPAAAPPAQAAENTPWYDPFHVFGTSPRQQVRPEQFGAEDLSAPPPPPGTPAAAVPVEPQALDSITAAVTDYSFNPYGRFLVILDNGQIWHQLASDPTTAHFPKGQKNTVTISRGFIGSYNITINDGPSYKVRRVK